MLLGDAEVGVVVSTAHVLPVRLRGGRVRPAARATRARWIVRYDKGAFDICATNLHRELQKAAFDLPI